MEHVFDSEESSSSGCESGWTLYLQHSIPHDDHFSWKKPSVVHENDQEDDNDGNEDDNMSMVSDASSGPPHFHEHQEHDEDEYCNNDKNNNSGNKNNDNGVLCYPTLALGCRKRRKILKQTSFDSHSHRHLQDLPVSLDDTASSPFFSYSNVSISFDSRFIFISGSIFNSINEIDIHS